MDLRGFSVKNIKTFMGMEGEGYNATLCRWGKIVATINDYGNGGPVHIGWKNFTAKDGTALLFAEQEFAVLAREVSDAAYEREVCLASDLVTSAQLGKKLLLKQSRGVVCHVSPDTPSCQWHESRMSSVSYEKCLASVKADHPNDTILDPNRPLDAAKTIGTLLCEGW